MKGERAAEVSRTGRSALTTIASIATIIGAIVAVVSLTITLGVVPKDNSGSGDTPTPDPGSGCNIEVNEQIGVRVEAEYERTGSSDVNASILKFIPERGKVKRGAIQCAQVRVKNTGNTKERFFIGYSMHGPNGERLFNPGPTKPGVTLTPGQSETVTVNVTIDRDASTGEYDAITAVWTDMNEESGDLDGRIIKTEEPDAFEVVNTMV